MTGARRGFTLIELLVGLAITSLFLLAFSSSLLSAAKAGKEISSNLFRYRYVRPFFLVFEKDLRNMVDSTSFPFRGRESECAFITFQQQSLRKVSYLWRNEALVREQETRRKVLVPQVKKLRIEYVYKDPEKGETAFLPFWLEAPYQGLPRAVKVSLEIQERGSPVLFSKVIDIPQGKWGILTSKH